MAHLDPNFDPGVGPPITPHRIARPRTFPLTHTRTHTQQQQPVSQWRADGGGEQQHIGILNWFSSHSGTKAAYAIAYHTLHLKPRVHCHHRDTRPKMPRRHLPCAHPPPSLAIARPVRNGV